MKRPDYAGLLHLGGMGPHELVVAEGADGKD
jgi:hypothetical protein